MTGHEDAKPQIKRPVALIETWGGWMAFGLLGTALYSLFGWTEFLAGAWVGVLSVAALQLLPSPSKEREGVKTAAMVVDGIAPREGSE